MAEPTYPPRNFDAFECPVWTCPSDQPLFRIHSATRDALYFGTGRGARFNDPDARYGMCYLGLSIRAAFVETILRNRVHDVVTEQSLALRGLSTITLTRELTLMPLHGSALSRVHANATAVFGRYAVSQAWSRAIHDHPACPDGIVYPTAHDNQEFAVALFDRASAAIQKPHLTVPLSECSDTLDDLADRYGFSLLDME